MSDGEVTIVTPDGEVVQAKQDDRVREAGAELGYQFRSRVRVGVTATYSTRRSDHRDVRRRRAARGPDGAVQPAAAESFR